MKGTSIRIIIAFVFTYFFICLSAKITSLVAQEGKPLSYEERIQIESIYGVYIPGDIAECFTELNKLISKESKTVFKNVSEEEAARLFHFSFGRWMQVNWAFYEGSRFSHYLRKLGVSFPDDMSQFVTILYHRYLNDTDLKIKELANGYLEKVNQKHLDKLKTGHIIKEGIVRKQIQPDVARDQ